MKGEHHFDPAAWLADFIAVGGAYMGNGDRVAFCWAVYGWSIQDNIRARQLYNLLDTDPAKWAAVLEHLKARMPQEVEP
jgi:hypothetical protein